MKPILIFVTAVFATGFVFAQPSRQSFAHLGTSDTDLWPVSNSFASDFDPTGGFVKAEGSTEVTGLDRSGNERTSTYGGIATASANYGQLKAGISASLTNTFYNPSNLESGIPNMFVGAGQATFTDTLHFVGTFMLPTFKVRYTYFVHGNVTGAAYGSLSMDIGTHYENLFLDSGDGPTIAQYYTTGLYELNPMLEHTISTNLLAGFQEDTQFLPDGINLSGAADFGSTVTLTNIEVFDANGNPFHDFTLNSDSGFSYPVSNAVPEPATLAALGLGGLALLRRRKRLL